MAWRLARTTLPIVHYLPIQELVVMTPAILNTIAALGVTLLVHILPILS